MNCEFENREIKEEETKSIETIRFGDEECPKCFSQSGYYNASLDCYVCGNCGHEF